MKPAPEYVSGNINDAFDHLGKVVSADQILDVVFVLGNDGSMMHYAGVFGGWRLYKQLPDMKTEEAVTKYVRDWLGSIYKEG